MDFEQFGLRRGTADAVHLEMMIGLEQFNCISVRNFLFVRMFQTMMIAQIFKALLLTGERIDWVKVADLQMVNKFTYAQ